MKKSHRHAHINPSSWEKNLTPFQRWMFCCVSIPFALIGVTDDFANDMPKCYRSQIGFGALMVSIAAATVFAGAGLGLWCVMQGVALAMRKSQRPKYYPQEKARRMRLAEERRKIRKRTTLNRAPTAEELMAQWAKIRKSPKEMIRFGSMLCDLEAYVDNSLVRDENGEITGRRPGIKGWLGENCPLLFAKYKTVMSYKAMAVKFRQAAGFADPYPPAEALPEEAEDAPREDSGGDGGNKTTVRKVLPERARAAAAEIISRSGQTQRGLLAELDQRLDPGKAPAGVQPTAPLRQVPHGHGKIRKNSA